MLSREVFIAFYGLEFQLLSLQVIGAFVVFRRFQMVLEDKKGGALEGTRLGLGVFLEGTQVLLEGV